MSGLPKGWVEATLDDFCAFENGDRGTNYSGRSTFVAIGVPFISAGHLNNGHIDWQEMNYIPQTNYDRLGSGKVKSGDFLFCLRGSLGKHAFVPKIDAAAIASSLVIVRPSQLIDCKFVDYYFRSPLVKSSIEVYSNGVAQPNLSSANLGRFGFPLPPLPEQKRIVAKLDALNAKSARARTELARIETLVSRYKQAVLSKALSGAKERLENYIISTFYGPRFSKENYVSDGIPTIRTTDFRPDGSIVITDAPRVAVNPQDLKKWSLEAGDLLVTRTGSIGKCAVYKASHGPALPSAYLIRVRLDLGRIDPMFAYYMMISPEGFEHLGVKTTAVTQPNINAEAIRSMPVPDIPLERQHEIVRRIESAFAKIDRLAKEAKRALELVGRLDEAILAKAFRGKLVAQDENDEPAEHLLARIRAERKAAPKGKRGRKSTI
ncbi:MAG: restriction endonuclease subunit S [Rhizobium sp.]|nr:restriction endonuclease subunit S [Rhizobium sp.]